MLITKNPLSDTAVESQSLDTRESSHLSHYLIIISVSNPHFVWFDITISQSQGGARDPTIFGGMEDWTNSASQDPGQRDQRAAGRIGSFARFGASSQACWCRLSLRCQHRSFHTGAFLKTKSSNWDKAYTGAKAPATATIMLEQMVTTAKGAQPSLSNPCAPPGCSARALAPRLLACKMRTGRCRSQCRSGNGPQLPSHQTLAPSLPPEALGANPCFNHSHRLSISLCRCS